MLVRFITVPLTSVRVVLAAKNGLQIEKKYQKNGSIARRPKIMAELRRWLSRKCVRMTKELAVQLHVHAMLTEHEYNTSSLLDIARIDLSRQ